MQKRVCVDANRCGNDSEKPKESRECDEYSLDENDSNPEGGEHSLDEYATAGYDTSQEESDESNFNPLTGLFFGDKEASIAGFAVLVGLVTVVSAGIYILAIRK